MASYTNTTKYLLRKLTGTSLVNEIDDGIAALADDVDSKMVGYSTGTVGARPTSTGGSPGIAGRRYRSTDETPPREYTDTGTGWNEFVTGDAHGDKLGLNISGSVRRGKSIIATEEARTNVAYGLMTTPDRVQNIVLPTDGLIAIGYQAMFKSSVASAGKTAIFIGANQLKVHMPGGAGPSVVQEAASPGTADLYKPMGTVPFGLYGYLGSLAFSGWGTTGEALAVHGDPTVTQPNGGICYVWAAAGTYDVSIQFKATSGSVSVKNRKLWVWTLGF